METFGGEQVGGCDGFSRCRIGKREPGHGEDRADHRSEQEQPAEKDGRRRQLVADSFNAVDQSVDL